MAIKKKDAAEATENQDAQATEASKAGEGSEAPPQVQAEEVERKNPAQWAAELKFIGTSNPFMPQQSRRINPGYACAVTLYAWDRHEHHYPKEPILLTKAEFLEAIGKATAFPLEAPLSAALSKLVASRFENFTAAKRR